MWGACFSDFGLEIFLFYAGGGYADSQPRRLQAPAHGRSHRELDRGATRSGDRECWTQRHKAGFRFLGPGPDAGRRTSRRSGGAVPALELRLAVRVGTDLRASRTREGELRRSPAYARGLVRPDPWHAEPSHRAAEAEHAGDPREPVLPSAGQSG